MAKSLSNIIIVTTTEILATSIDSYFRQIALVAAFEDSDLNAGQTFATAGYEEYETIDDVAVKFPASHQVYKWASDAFAQKTGSGVNGSVFEKLVVVQKKTTDADYETALNRVDYRDAYWILPLTDVVAEVESVYDWVSTKYMLMLTQDDSTEILDAGDDTDIASTLKDANSTRASVWYHSDSGEGLISAMAAIMASANPGDRAAFYKEPSGITVDTIASTGLTSLDAKNANYFTKLVGSAGDFNSSNITFNGVLADGDKIQKKYQTDRIVLTLQTSGMDTLKQDIPYDNRGGARLETGLASVLQGFKTQEIIKDQTFVNRDGTTVNGYWVDVEKTEDTKVNSLSDYNAQTFRVRIDYVLALTAELVKIDIQFSV